MDWMNRGDRPAQPAAPQPSAGGPAHGQTHAAVASKKRAGLGSDVLRWGLIALLLSAAVLAVATIGYIVVGGKNEGTFVKNKQMQAVFLNGGQVYFGHITDLNGKFLRLSDIYYLRVNQQVQPNQSTSSSSNDISLVKLGCELHGPDDSMLINREQVIFWENLKADGQVAQAVDKYVKENPNGQNCSQQNTSGANNTSNTANTSTDTTNTGSNTDTTSNKQ